jgi:hypothetical protein
MAGLLDEIRKSELLAQAQSRLQGLLNIPTAAQQFMVSPTSFMGLLGRNPLPRETGFAAGATGLPAQEMSVLDPNQAPYMQGYSQGEPIGYGAMALPMVKPTAKALAPKAGEMAENYLRSIGGIADIVPTDVVGTIKNALPNDYHTLNTMVTKAYDNLLKNPNSKEFYEQYMSLRKARDVAPVNNPSNIQQTIQAVADDYRGQHQAPMRDSGKPLHDLTDVYPDDFYSSKAVQYYGTGDPSDYRVINQLQYLKNKPNEPVWMYRAVPKDAPSEINRGDWVTIDRNYAKEHGESALNGEYKIIKRKATAKDLYTNGDSPYEMGYDPVNTKKVEGLLD